MAGRNMGVDAARGGAMLLVVLLHADVIAGNGAVTASFDAAAVHWRMPVLLLISGVLLRNITADPRRAARRLLDHLWLMLIWTPVLACDKTMLGIVGEIVLPRSELWFLWITGLILGAVAVVPATHRTGLIVLFAGVATMTAILSRAAGIAGPLEREVADPTLPVPLCLLSSMRYAMFFLVGLLAAGRIEREFSRVGGGRLARWLGAMGVAAAAVAASPIFGVLLGLTTTFVAVQLGALTSHTAPTRLLAAIGRATLPIYLCHYTLLRLAHRVTGDVTQSWHILALTGLAIGGSLAAYRAAGAAGAAWLFHRPTGRVRQPALVPAHA